MGRRDVGLTTKEYRMLELLAMRQRTPITKDMFLSHLYGGMDETGQKIIDVFVCKLRKKLMQASGGRAYVETIGGRCAVLRDPEPGACRFQHLAGQHRSRVLPSLPSPVEALRPG